MQKYFASTYFVTDPYKHMPTQEHAQIFDLTTCVVNK